MGYPVYKLIRAVNRQYPNNGFINHVDVNEDLDEGEGNKLVDEDLRDLINEAIQETYIHIAKDEVFSFPTVGGQNQYVLPEDCDLRNIQEVTRTFGGAFAPIMPRELGPEAIAVITFNKNGGTGMMHKEKVPYGEIYVIPQCEYEGSSAFLNWRDQNGNNLYPGDEIQILEDLELTAIWEITTWRASFIANGGTGTMHSIIVDDGEYLWLPECTFIPPENQEFKCWKDSRDVELQPGTSFLMLQDEEFVAVYKQIHYFANFAAGEGTGDTITITSQTHSVYGYEYITIPQCTFTPPSGMEFKNWVDQNNHTYNPGVEYRMEDNVNFTATYETEIHNVSIYILTVGGTGILHTQQEGGSLVKTTMTYGGTPFTFTVAHGSEISSVYPVCAMYDDTDTILVTNLADIEITEDRNIGVAVPVGNGEASQGGEGGSSSGGGTAQDEGRDPEESGGSSGGSSGGGSSDDDDQDPALDDNPIGGGSSGGGAEPTDPGRDPE